METAEIDRPRVVVGVNDSAASAAALAWAHDACRTYGWSLDVVTAWPGRGEIFVHEVPGHYCAPRARAVAALQEALESCGVELDGPTVTVHIENADPMRALDHHSRGAHLLVLGASRHRHRLGLAPLSEVCRLRVDCPVVVVDEHDLEQPRTA
jgi:nucleotide-binding universal stress UspA family protein